MDQVTQIGGLLGIIVTVVGIVYSAINHKRLRSTCCGRKIDIAFDVESTTPPALRQVPVKPESDTSDLEKKIEK